jgi:hypothetical protein
MVDVDGLQALSTLTPADEAPLAGGRLRASRPAMMLSLTINGSTGLPLLLRRSSLRERLLVLRAFLTLARVESYVGSGRAAVLLRRLRSHPVKGTRRPSADEARVVADQVIWAVESAARCFPTSRCLATASAGFLLLRGAGIDVDLVIGATFDKTGGLASHAWLELDQEILFENPMKGRIYRPLVRCSSAPERAAAAASA